MKKNNKRMGRPKKIIDKNAFEKLCALQCTQKEICSVLDVTDKTLNAWCKRTYNKKTFSEVFSEKRSVGKISLRRSQWKLAERNATMAIWLGKQYLNQQDVTNQNVKIDGDIKTNNPFESITTMDLLKMREKLIKEDG